MFYGAYRVSYFLVIFNELKIAIPLGFLVGGCVSVIAILFILFFKYFKYRLNLLSGAVRFACAAMVLLVWVCFVNFLFSAKVSMVELVRPAFRESGWEEFSSCVNFKLILRSTSEDHEVIYFESGADRIQKITNLLNERGVRVRSQ